MELLKWVYARLSWLSIDPLGVALSEDGKFAFQPCVTDPDDIDEAWKKGGFIRFASVPDGHVFTIVPGQLPAEKVESLRLALADATWKAGLDRHGKVDIGVDTRQYHFREGSKDIEPEP